MYFMAWKSAGGYMMKLERRSYGRPLKTMARKLIWPYHIVERLILNFFLCSDGSSGMVAFLSLIC